MGRTPPLHASPRADRDLDWSWSADDFDALLEQGGWHAAAEAHAWFNPDLDSDHDPPHQRGAYKLPHHAVVDGRMRVVWRGVVSAMTVLNGARSGLDIPATDRRGVYEHLVRHYREFDEQPPELAHDSGRS